MESIRMHIKEEYRNINMYIYFASEDRKNSTFNYSINHNLNRNGVKNLDSNLTARIKETSKKEYQTRVISFSNPNIDSENHTVSYKIYYSSKNQNPDDFYTLNLYFKNTDYENDIYSKEEQEQKARELEKKRREKEAQRIAQDPELMNLIVEYIKELKR